MNCLLDMGQKIDQKSHYRILQIAFALRIIKCSEWELIQINYWYFQQRKFKKNIFQVLFKNLHLWVTRWYRGFVLNLVKAYTLDQGNLWELIQDIIWHEKDLHHELHKVSNLKNNDAGASPRSTCINTDHSQQSSFVIASLGVWPLSSGIKDAIDSTVMWWKLTEEVADIPFKLPGKNEIFFFYQARIYFLPSVVCMTIKIIFRIESGRIRWSNDWHIGHCITP